jgi:hypothetical protein
MTFFRSYCARLLPFSAPLPECPAKIGAFGFKFDRSELMRLNTVLRFLGVAFVFLVIPTFSAAQQSVTCEANNDNRKYCGSYNPDQVRMDRQISGSPCIEGQTWGVDRQGLWVQQGCRAVFIIRGYSGGGPGPGGPDRPGWWDVEPDATWPPRGDWHGGRWERGGACFYKDPSFGGGFFCLRRGEQRESLGDYGDKISSIRVFGNAHVTVYDDRNFRGANGNLNHDRPDLRDWSVRQKPGHSWNDRISCLAVQ